MSDTLASYVRRLMQGRRVEDVAEQAKVGRSTLYAIRSGDATHPDSETLRRLAPVIRADEDILLSLAGHLTEVGEVISDPEVIRLARDLEALANPTRGAAIQALRAQLDTIYTLIQGQTEHVSPFALDALENAIVQWTDEEQRERAEFIALLEWVKEQAPQFYRQYVKERAAEILAKQQGHALPEPALTDRGG